MVSVPSVTLEDAYASASAYWQAKGRSSRMMAIRAKLGMDLLGSDKKLASLGAADGAILLTKLRQRGLQRASERSYYAAFKRMLYLSGKQTHDWPKAGAPLRRVRDPLTPEDVGKIKGWLAGRAYFATASLVDVLEQTGMRVDVEALNPEAVEPQFGALKVTGKGGHERVIPVARTEDLWGAIVSARTVPYQTHLKRWKQAVAELGITSRKPTPHAVRHLYATQAYERSGRNLVAVKELLGHADVSTTAGYIGVDLDTLRAAAGA